MANLGVLDFFTLSLPSPRAGGVAVTPALGLGGPVGVVGSVTCFERTGATSSFLVVLSFCLAFSNACRAFEAFLTSLSDFLPSFLADSQVCLDLGGAEVAGGAGSIGGKASPGSRVTPVGTCVESSVAVGSSGRSMVSTRMDPP